MNLRSYLFEDLCLSKEKQLVDSEREFHGEIFDSNNPIKFSTDESPQIEANGPIAPESKGSFLKQHKNQRVHQLSQLQSNDPSESDSNHLHPKNKFNSISHSPKKKFENSRSPKQAHSSHKLKIHKSSMKSPNKSTQTGKLTFKFLPVQKSSDEDLTEVEPFDSATTDFSEIAQSNSKTVSYKSRSGSPNGQKSNSFSKKNKNSSAEKPNHRSTFDNSSEESDLDQYSSGEIDNYRRTQSNTMFSQEKKKHQNEIQSNYYSPTQRSNSYQKQEHISNKKTETTKGDYPFADDFLNSSSSISSIFDKNTTENPQVNIIRSTSLNKTERRPPRISRFLPQPTNENTGSLASTSPTRNHQNNMQSSNNRFDGKASRFSQPSDEKFKSSIVSRNVQHGSAHSNSSKQPNSSDQFTDEATNTAERQQRQPRSSSSRKQLNSNENLKVKASTKQSNMKHRSSTTEKSPRNNFQLKAISFSDESSNEREINQRTHHRQHTTENGNRVHRHHSSTKTREFSPEKKAQTMNSNRFHQSNFDDDNRKLARSHSAKSKKVYQDDIRDGASTSSEKLSFKHPKNEYHTGEKKTMKEHSRGNHNEKHPHNYRISMQNREYSVQLDEDFANSPRNHSPSNHDQRTRSTSPPTATKSPGKKRLSSLKHPEIDIPMASVIPHSPNAPVNDDFFVFFNVEPENHIQRLNCTEDLNDLIDEPLKYLLDPDLNSSHASISHSTLKKNSN